MEALLRDLRRECWLRRGCEGHTGGVRYIYVEIHARGFEMGELKGISAHTLCADATCLKQSKRHLLKHAKQRSV